MGWRAEYFCVGHFEWQSLVLAIMTFSHGDKKAKK